MQIAVVAADVDELDDEEENGPVPVVGNGSGYATTVFPPLVLERLFPVEVASIELVPITAVLDPTGPDADTPAELVVTISSDELGGWGTEIGGPEGALEVAGATS